MPSPDKSLVGSQSSRLSFGPTSEFARSLTDKDILDLPSPDRASSKNLDLSPAASEIKEKKQVFLPQAPQKSGTFPFRIRGKQTFDKKQIQQIKWVLNLQHSRPNRTGNVPRQGFGGFQVFPASNHLKTPWWQCPLCEFQIFKNETDGENDAHHARQRHLKNVHGQVAPPLPKGNVMNAPHRLIQANVGLNIRWMQKYKIFQRVKNGMVLMKFLRIPIIGKRTLPWPLGRLGLGLCINVGLVDSVFPRLISLCTCVA